MANTKSALKAIRVSERRRRRNQPIRSGVKTAIRKARQAIATGNIEAATAATIAAASKLDKAVSKGVLHWRNAARRKSRLMRKLNQASKAPPITA
ncbi:MAG TPA: 30S ribosomal protein S20 [Chloroflexota bacterium]|nr:30S ribosomal protein S20 [Chloroflexota bacterium]